MNTQFITALIYLLGFIGLASIGLLPFRSWRVLRSAFKGASSLISKRVLVVFLALIIAGALLFDVLISARIFKCLTEIYCGPNVASGWTYLAMLGVVYMAFEVIIFVLEKIGWAKEAERNAVQ